MELIFVYNADSGLWNGYLDMMHKVVSPATYSCHLCAITYGTFSIRQEWKNFLSHSSIQMQFLHRDEWALEFGIKASLPAIFIRENGQIREWLSAREMKQMSLKDLMDHLNQHDAKRR